MNLAVSHIDIPAFNPTSYDAAVRAACQRAQHSFFDSHVIEDGTGASSPSTKATIMHFPGPCRPDRLYRPGDDGR